MNQVVMTGNLTRDPESRVINSGGRQTTVVNFTIATNRKFKTKGGELKEETNFFQCEAWDSGAEAIANHFVKGSPILVSGTLKNDVWEKDGQKHTTTKIRVDRFEFFQTTKGRLDRAEESEPEPVAAGVTDDAGGDGNEPY